MLVVSKETLDSLIQEIASKTRDITDHNGQVIILPTVTDKQLRAAALTALTVAVGQAVWPADQPIEIPQQSRGGAVKVREG